MNPEVDIFVDESQIEESFLGSGTEGWLFQVSHKYICILWSYVCAHNYAIDMLFPKGT